MKIRNALILAGLMLAFAVVLAAADRGGYIGDETSKRASQVLAGLVVVYFANLMPKAVEQPPEGCELSRLQSFQRFSGWTLVLAGLGYSAAWLVLPFEHARVVAMALLGSGVAIVVTRLVWALATRAR